ncbi:Site-specific recombinase [Amycolatopsis camponoti]|uniref:Site-specific recombinase n=1 Tax=Amycolatopsis camponoti TaxID=2606593 RepID=A0A6I8LZ00_9PSEU|nr:recombinase family protein [Amycolatopsis camponoti]VVJ21648.1 Site-specific recombinase [Amycolatopsis camponoti]
MQSFAFYGRCSTEDQQDPATSRSWQLRNACRFIAPLGGQVVEEYFDVGQSRSVPWHRRPEAGRLLDGLKPTTRRWTAVVGGEGTRCWFGNQFSLTAPRMAAYNVELWVTELGGPYQPRTPPHTMLMSLLGGISESERQHVQARVRASMDAQVINEGRHEGGRPPYGYIVIDGGPHPHPRKAADGLQLRVLHIDDEAATVVRRIFTEYLRSLGDHAIATGLNRDRIPCPSARHPEQNTHRRGDRWLGRTIRSILENPRYTGYAVFGRWTKTEVLLDPDDVSAGHTVRFRRASPDRVVRSRLPAHPAIVTVQQFTQVQLRRRAKTLAGRSRAERHGRRTRHEYLFQGLIRCATCDRKMESSTTGRHHYYRCVQRGTSRRATHPHSVSVREDRVHKVVSAWLAELDAESAPSGREIDHIDPASAQRTDLAEIYRDLQLVVAYDHRTATLAMSLKLVGVDAQLRNRLAL